MISRREAINLISKKLNKNDLVISTTGMISRELFELFDRVENFYMIGSMGLASSFALGIALSNPKMNIFILDGDGSFIMNGGAAYTIGYYKPQNLTHIVLDNKSYQSTGNQESISGEIDFCRIAESSGYEIISDLNNTTEEDIMKINFNTNKLSFYRINVDIKNSDLTPRVSHSPKSITTNFSKRIN
jgi:thiamine pyrophosphate-dependent acetolactate synthase large subunit-like protein